MLYCLFKKTQLMKCRLKKCCKVIRNRFREPPNMLSFILIKNFFLISGGGILKHDKIFKCNRKNFEVNIKF